MSETKKSAKNRTKVSWTDRNGHGYSVVVDSTGRPQDQINLFALLAALRSSKEVRGEVSFHEI